MICNGYDDDDDVCVCVCVCMWIHVNPFFGHVEPNMSGHVPSTIVASLKTFHKCFTVMVIECFHGIHDPDGKSVNP